MCSNVWSTTETLPVEVDYLGNWTTVFHNNDVSSLVSSWKENETYSMIITASSNCSSDMHLGWSGFDNGGFIFDVNKSILFFQNSSRHTIIVSILKFGKF